MIIVLLVKVVVFNLMCKCLMVNVGRCFGEIVSCTFYFWKHILFYYLRSVVTRLVKLFSFVYFYVPDTSDKRRMVLRRLVTVKRLTVLCRQILVKRLMVLRRQVTFKRLTEFWLLSNYSCIYLSVTFKLYIYNLYIYVSLRFS
ncbi:hypothetical protein BD770DRAFT_397640 [Pilaira anomala]|nr:hypothetical protein BD770DRAFT_397640 [Pilaira anomala]